MSTFAGLASFNVDKTRIKNVNFDEILPVSHAKGLLRFCIYFMCGRSLFRMVEMSLRCLKVAFLGGAGGVGIDH